ncbi:hypothetical protein SAMN05216368_10991 [Cryobacterium flavum]|uniref:Lipoprotein n=3 Tax=Cryobacterium flavum TaxID=1424659 RepID=A0A5E9G0W1_9MICO|nr:hypothetical protein SAMN05216368_10991 [Cryobacterium flavum]
MRTRPRRRPMHKAVHIASMVFLAAGTLSGCSAAPTPSPHGSSEPAAEATAAPTETPPVFASNEEALAAAAAAYGAYLTAGDTAGAEGSDSWIKYLALTTGLERDDEVKTKKELEQNGWRFSGTTSFDSMTVQSFNPRPDGRWEVRAYVCLDLSQSQKVDASGIVVSDPNRLARWPLVVTFKTPDEISQQLLISESTVWSGSNFC